MSFGMNERPKVARIPKQVVRTSTKAWTIVPSVKHEFLAILDSFSYKELT